MTDPSRPQSLDAPDPSADPAVDEQITRARNGDRVALEEVCQHFYPEISTQVHNSLARDYRQLRPWLSSLLSTGDIVHDVFLSVVRGIDGFRGESKREFASYLATLTRNRLVDMVRFHEASRRDARRVEPTADHFEPANGRPPDVIAESTEDVARAHEILRSFPARDRALLRGHLEDNIPFNELAQTLGYASADSARKSYHAVQARLLTRLQRRDV